MTVDIFGIGIQLLNLLGDDLSFGIHLFSHEIVVLIHHRLRFGIDFCFGGRFHRHAVFDHPIAFLLINGWLILIYIRLNIWQ